MGVFESKLTYLLGIKVDRPGDLNRMCTTMVSNYIHDKRYCQW